VYNGKAAVHLKRCATIPVRTRLSLRVERLKYPKLAAALDELLAKQVRESGEDLIMYAIAKLCEPASSPEGAVDEKLPSIPVTKELILSEQTEVRDAD
jgi:hypothetical protein